MEKLRRYAQTEQEIVEEHYLIKLHQKFSDSAYYQNVENIKNVKLA